MNRQPDDPGSEPRPEPGLFRWTVALMLVGLGFLIGMAAGLALSPAFASETAEGQRPIYAILYVCTLDLCREISIPFDGPMWACRRTLPMIAASDVPHWRPGEKLVRFECLEGEPV